VQTDPAHGSSHFDTANLDSIWFTVTAGEYDFCISDLELLNADGDEVAPP
jgi:hypothetical protein